MSTFNCKNDKRYEHKDGDKAAVQDDRRRREREEVEKKQMKEEKKHCLTLLSVFVVPLRIAIAWAETFLKNLIDSLLRTPMPKWRSMRASQGKSAVFGNNTTLF